MLYFANEQLLMLCNALGFCFLGICLIILLNMNTKRYGRKLARKCVREYGTNFNSELSLALSPAHSGSVDGFDERKRFQERKKIPGEKRLQNVYDTAKALAEQGLNVERILEEVNLPRNEIELIVKWKRMHARLPERNKGIKYGDYGISRLQALRGASEKIAHDGLA